MSVVTGPDNQREEKISSPVRLYEKDLLRTCCVYLRDRDMAQDAVQETFLKAYKALGSFRSESTEKTWLYSIALNVCRDMQRKTWWRLFDRRITPEDLPLAATPAEEDSIALTAAIMRLPQKLQEVTLLHYYQDMTTREIADALQISQSSVSSRLVCARTRLRAFLERGESV